MVVLAVAVAVVVVMMDVAEINYVIVDHVHNLVDALVCQWMWFDIFTLCLSRA